MAQQKPALPCQLACLWPGPGSLGNDLAECRLPLHRTKWLPAAVFRKRENVSFHCSQGTLFVCLILSQDLGLYRWDTDDDGGEPHPFFSNPKGSGRKLQAEADARHWAGEKGMRNGQEEAETA